MGNRTLEFNEEEWDVLLFIVSHMAGHASPPTRENVLQAGVAQYALQTLEMEGLLQEQNGTLQPTRKMLTFTNR